MKPEYVILTVLILLELYYWLWWLPRNWRRNRECRQLVSGMKKLYGKDGIVWKLMKRGKL